MPRARVRDEDRKRAAKACTLCKSSKTRCDSQTPCGRCLKHGRASSCEYVQSSALLRRQALPAASARSRALEHHPVQNESFRPTSTCSAEPRRSPEQSFEDAGRGAHPTPRSPEGTQSRMLQSNGGRVFVGEIASLSFLQFLRRTLRYHLGRSRFTEPASKNIMLETKMHENTSGGTLDDGISRKILLVHCYLEATAGIFDLFTKSQIYSLLKQTPLTSSDQRDNKTRKIETAALHLIVAIGAQCRSNTELDRQSATKNFESGQRIAFEGLLLDPSLTMIRLFLLMSFYKLGACQRNGAFMYLGVAGKCACALGLHRSDHSNPISLEEQSLRLRLWKSLSILEIIVNSVLGRPHSLPDAEFETSTEQTVVVSELTDLRKAAFEATYNACSHLCLILKKVSNCNRIDLSVAESFLEQLRRWSHDLSPGLRQFTDNRGDRSDNSKKEILIGNVHVACVYYFAVTLITRPFFISHLLSNFQSKQVGSSLAKKRADEGRVSNLANVCLEAAISMTKVSKSVLDAGGLFGNMCLLKAFIFAAGLLLGFSLFADDSNSAMISETEVGFDNAREVLLYFSEQSPQAQLYHVILTDFSEAISKHRQQLREKRKRMINQYIDQSFTAGSTMNDPSHHDESRSEHDRIGDGSRAGPRQHDILYLNPSSDAMETGNNINDGPSNFSPNNPSTFSYDAISLGSEDLLHIGDPLNLPLLWNDFGVDWQDGSMSIFS